MFDLAIVGGGINGTGIARAAAGRGLRVLLVEQNDLASGTSSASTKLIHGGLRYLEHGWLRLVREALSEREVMLRMAPHLIRPMRFVLPSEPGVRPAWMLRLGLFVYDHLGGRQNLPPARAIDLANDPLGAPLRKRYERGFEYSDCFADDSRLVVLTALDAAERGAVIRTRTRCIRAERGAAWRLVLDRRGRRDVASAHILVNTDQAFAGDPSGVAPTADEIAYLCDVANAHFRKRLHPADVVWSFAGVRALYDDGSKRAQDVSRDYVLSLDQREAPLLTVYGGKITTYRRLAEQAIDRIAHIVKAGPAWTKGSHLPGGDFSCDGLEALVAHTRKSRPFLSEEHALRLVRAYGTRVERVLGSARSLEDLGPCIGADLTAAELRYLMEQEWAQTADDVLWRRTKLGLRFSSTERARLANVMAAMVTDG